MTDSEDVSTLFSSAAVVFAGTILHSVARLLERVVVGRAVTPGAYGEVSIGISLMAIGVTLSLCGYFQGIPRFMSRFDEPSHKRGAWVSGAMVAAAIAVLLAGTLLLAGDEVLGLVSETPGSYRLLQLFVVAIPFVVGLRVGVAGIRGFENTVYKASVQDIFYPGTRIASLALFLSLGYGALAAGFAYLLGAVLSMAAALLLLNELMGLWGPVRTRTREMFAFSTPLLLSSFLADLLTRVDTIMIGYFRPSLEAGLYGAAYPLANGLLLALGAFGYLYLPLVSRLDAVGDRDSIDELYALSTKWIFVVTFPAFALFFAFPADVISTFFGSDYVSASLALPILTVGFFTSVAMGANRSTLTALGYTPHVLAANAAAFGFNLVSNLLLIPRYGFHGAAVASASSFVLLNLLISAVLWRELGAHPASGWNRRVFLALPAVVLSFAFAASAALTLTAVTIFPFLLLLGALSILVVAVVGGFQPEDELLLELVEERAGRRIPYVRRVLPDHVGRGDRTG